MSPIIHKCLIFISYSLTRMISIIHRPEHTSQLQACVFRIFHKREIHKQMPWLAFITDMKKFFKFVLYTTLIISVGWVTLTIIAERTGPPRSWQYGEQRSTTRVIVVYDPDPFFNLDEQVCRSFGQALGENGILVNVLSVSAAKEIQLSSFDVYVFCANTYNWGPDMALTNFIKENSLESKPVIALTLGAGSTSLSQERLEKIIVNHGGKIMDTRAVWLMRPNDESRSEESNVKVAVSKVRTWAISLTTEIKTFNQADNYHQRN